MIVVMNVVMCFPLAGGGGMGDWGGLINCPVGLSWIGVTGQLDRVIDLYQSIPAPLSPTVERAGCMKISLLKVWLVRFVSLFSCVRFPEGSREIQVLVGTLMVIERGFSWVGKGSAGGGEGMYRPDSRAQVGGKEEESLRCRVVKSKQRDKGPQARVRILRSWACFERVR